MSVSMRVRNLHMCVYVDACMRVYGRGGNDLQYPKTKFGIFSKMVFKELYSLEHDALLLALCTVTVCPTIYFCAPYCKSRICRSDGNG